MQSNQKAASYLFSPLSLFALSDCSSPAAPGCDHNMPEKQQLTSPPSNEVNSAGNNQFLSFLFEVWFFAAAGLESSCHTLTCCGDELDSHSLTGRWGLNGEPLHTWCHATSGSKPPTVGAVPPSGRAQSWAAVGFQDDKMCPELWARLQLLTFQWYFRWTDPSNDSSPRVMFSNEQPPLLFFDSLHDRSRGRQALSAFLILTFSSSWGWTWLAPAHPAPGEMTHSLFFFQNTVKYFDLWASDWPTSSYTQSLWHDTAHLNGSCSLFRCTLIRLLPQRHAWPLHDEPTFWMCVVLSQKSSPKKRLHSIFKMLDRGGITRCSCVTLWNAILDTWQRQCSAFRKKRPKETRAKLRNAFFFFFCIFQVKDKIFMSLFQQCADRQTDI